MSLISQFHRQIRTYIYNPVYKGPFEYKKYDSFTSKFPFGVNRTKLEAEANEIREIRNIEIKDDEVSPFHLVWRNESNRNTMWTDKVILRRLGLHQKKRKIPAVIPNTPHYNAMLWQIKHLICLKPIKFPNGIPTEEDIGSIKVDLNAGEMMIDSKFKIDQEKLDLAERPEIFNERYLRQYLKWSSGLMGGSLPSHEVKKIDGSHIEDFDRQMRDYYKHQHPFYKKKVN